MTWLIVRGLVREVRHWGDFPEVLEKHLKETDPEAKVFTIDFPGFGSETDRPSPTSISEIVDDMRGRFLKYDTPGKPWVILSMSLGGMVGMNWVSRYPEDFKKIILI